MFPEEANIIFSLLADNENKKILNVCSSGEFFWKRQQPYIWKTLLEPLLQNGNEIINLDIQPNIGVDIVNDCTDMIDVFDRSFDIVLFNSAVEHIEDVQAALGEIKRVIKSDGIFVASAPGVFPKHDAPIDTLLRLPNLEDWEQLLGPGWEIENFRKTTPIPAKPFYKFAELVFATIIKAHRKIKEGKIIDTETQVLSKSIPIVSEEEYIFIITQHKVHFENLENIIIQSGALPEGNCFYQNMTMNKRSELLPKQRNLFSVARAGDRIMEIGFNAGHSVLLFLLANPRSKITCFDLCTYAYTHPGFNYLADNFPDRLRIFKGNSNLTVAEFYKNNPIDKFDVLHIDGGHWLNVAHSDFVNCRNIAAEDSIVIWDDVDIPRLGSLWEQYIMQGFVTPFEMLPTPMYAHAFGTFSKLDVPIVTNAKQMFDHNSEINYKMPHDYKEKPVINTTRATEKSKALTKSKTSTLIVHLIGQEPLEFSCDERSPILKTLFKALYDTENNSRKKGVLIHLQIKEDGNPQDIFLRSSQMSRIEVTPPLDIEVLRSLNSPSNHFFLRCLRKAKTLIKKILVLSYCFIHAPQPQKNRTEEALGSLDLAHSPQRPNKLGTVRESDGKQWLLGKNFFIHSFKSLFGNGINDVDFGFSVFKQNEIMSFSNDRESIFNEIYDKHMWGGLKKGFYSGRGSEDYNTREYIEFVNNFISTKNISKIVDFGCGDFRVGGKINLKNLNYVGIDIVDKLIKSNNKMFKENNVEFIKKDIVDDELPDGDLCLIRQVLQHLSNEDIKQVLLKLKKYKYVLITDGLPQKNPNIKNINKPTDYNNRYNELYNSGLYLDWTLDKIMPRQII
ncbi:MAG: methyltransferase domain-containing protein [bacterium]|nr:methyltransferase domain-containing protein [bacterium]